MALITAAAVATSIIGASLAKMYFNGGVNSNKPDLSGKIIIVTGANAGIGYYTVQELAKLKPKLIILACRNKERAEQAIESIKKVVPDANLLFMHLDLSDLNTVKKFAIDFHSKFENLDLLINNAGLVSKSQRQTTAQGFEMTLGSNHIGHFLLTKLLLKSLLKSKEGRIINVSSKAHEQAIINFNDIQMQQDYGVVKAYSQSKLANVYFTRELQNKLTGTSIKVVSLHPGVVRTEIQNNTLDNFVKQLLFKLVQPFIYFFGKNGLQGAQTTLYCALCDFEKLEAGSYYSDCAVKKETFNSKNWKQEMIKLWDLSEEWTKQFHLKSQ